MLTFLFFLPNTNKHEYIYIYIYASPPAPQDQYFDSLADVHVSEHCFPCWCGGVTGIQKIFWLLGRSSCVRALFSMLITILLVLFIQFPFPFRKSPALRRDCLFILKILPYKLLLFLKKSGLQRKKATSLWKKVRSSIQRNIFSVCINWTFLSSPFFEEQFILYHS